MTEPAAEEVRARAVDALRAHGDPLAADLLASCTVYLTEDEAGDVSLEVVGPLVSQPGLFDLTQPMAATLAAALREGLPAGVWVERLVARPAEEPRHSSTVTGGAQQIALHTSGLNQAAGELAPRMWSGMRFRSESELRLAQALDGAGVLFFPDALARLGPPHARQNREADFLVCWQGAWGILEVDGEPFHGHDRAGTDVERDQLFRQHGLEVIEHVDAARCFATPDRVVEEFLAILQQRRSR
jgi:hypothetical protein